MFEAQTNAAELAEAIRRYADAMPRVMLGVLTSWTASTTDIVRSDAPVDLGGLTASCYGDAVRGADGPDAIIVAGKEYAPPVEFGSAPHEITPKRAGGMLRFPHRNGGWAFAPSVQHPGTAAQPFFFENIAGQLDDLGSLTTESLGELARRVGLEGGT